MLIIPGSEISTGHLQSDRSFKKCILKRQLIVFPDHIINAGSDLSEVLLSAIL